MTQLEATFYSLGIVYMILNIIILLGIGVGLVYIIKTVMEIKTQVEEKLRYVDRMIQEPEEVVAEVGGRLVKAGFRKAKSALRKAQQDDL